MSNALWVGRLKCVPRWQFWRVLLRRSLSLSWQNFEFLTYQLTFSYQKSQMANWISQLFNPLQLAVCFVGEGCLIYEALARRRGEHYQLRQELQQPSRPITDPPALGCPKKTKNKNFGMLLSPVVFIGQMSHQKKFQHYRPINDILPAIFSFTL